MRAPLLFIRPLAKVIMSGRKRPVVETLHCNVSTSHRLYFLTNSIPTFQRSGFAGKLSQEKVTNLPRSRRILPVERQVLSAAASGQLNMRLRVANTGISFGPYYNRKRLDFENCIKSRAKSLCLPGVGIYLLCVSDLPDGFYFVFFDFWIKSQDG